MKDKTCAVILAAGDGTRMKSEYPKVMCEVLFKPMISWVTDNTLEAGINNACVVIREKEKRITPLLPAGFSTAEQGMDKSAGYGTGYAVKMAAQYIKNGEFSDVVVLFGDAPFISGDDITASFNQHKAENNVLTVLTANIQNPDRFGRIVRDNGKLSSIVEYKDADEETRKITEINSGAMWFKADFLLEALENLNPNNAQGEYYLTDTVEYAVKSGRPAGACIVSSEAVLGANDRKGLAELNKIALQKVLDKHMDNGVNIPFADGIVIGADVEIGADTTILPGTIIKEKTTIGKNCEIGPNSNITDAVIKDDCNIISTYIDSSVIEDNVKIGPMCNIRPNCHIMQGAKIGDFVEIKNAVIGEKTAVAHLTYVGDSDVGAGCNFGCGVVTVNYDGTNKHRTVIGDNAFIGCNTNLVAPVKMGSRSYSAAGTTVTGDVPEGALVVGRVKQVIKEGWAEKTGRFSKK